jgi:ABC-type transporter Mla MlaB component
MSETLVSAARKDGKTLITLGSTLDVRYAADLKKKMSTLLRRKPPFELDGAQVDRVDTAGLQVLFAFILEARSRGIDITWRMASDSLKTAARLIDLQDQLGIAA